MLFISFIGASLFTDHLGRYPDIRTVDTVDIGTVNILDQGSKMDKDMEKQNMKAIKNEKRSKFKTRKKEGTNPKSGNLHWNMDVIHIFIKCQYD